MARGFSFGRNWDRYIRESFSEERVEISRRHLLEFLGLAGLEGRSFLDIGCGSGIHSLAAFRAGASRVVSMDVDRFSVRATMRHVYRTFLRTKSPAYLLHNFRYIRDYRALRGMAFWTDVRDWLGGWPYEPATPAEVTGFCEKTLGLRTVKVKGGEANVEYLFARG